MQTERLEILLHQYFNNTISKADCIELLEFLNQTNPEDVAEVIDQHVLSDMDKGPKFSKTQSLEILKRIRSDSRFVEYPDETSSKEKFMVRLYQHPWTRAAAMVLIFLACGFYFLKNNKEVQTFKDEVVRKKQSDVQTVPGKATLTLENGKVVSLNEKENGLFSAVGSTSIHKKNGQLIYTNNPLDSGFKNTKLAYNTLSTSKGAEYQVQLPDGTKVWLNSASSLSFPKAFTNKERHVKLTGEAYFEVAPDSKKPFYVSIEALRVKVLGTHFNVSAYADEDNITTTLLEGAVQLIKSNKHSLLKPGQQGVVEKGSDLIKVSAADVESAMAWKNGYFIFNAEDIKSIMKKVSRWYDVDVEYQGNIENQRFGGTFYRTKSINELLLYLEKIGKLHFKIIGRRVIVMN